MTFLISHILMTQSMTLDCSHVNEDHHNNKLFLTRAKISTGFWISIQKLCLSLKSLVQSSSTPRSCKTILEEHAYDSHHGQTSIGDFRVEFLLFDLRILNRFATQVSRNAQEAILVIRSFFTEEASAQLSGWVFRHLMHEPKVAKAAEDGVLGPSNGWHFGHCCKSIGDIWELDFTRRREVSWKSQEFLDDVSSASSTNDTSETSDQT